MHVRYIAYENSSLSVFCNESVEVIAPPLYICTITKIIMANVSRAKYSKLIDELLARCMFRLRVWWTVYIHGDFIYLFSNESNVSSNFPWRNDGNSPPLIIYHRCNSHVMVCTRYTSRQARDARHSCDWSAVPINAMHVVVSGENNVSRARHVIKIQLSKSRAQLQQQHATLGSTYATDACLCYLK